MCAIHAVHALSSAVTNLTNKTLIFHDFQRLTIKFRDFPGLENEILKFHDFPGFSWPVWTLQWDWVFPVSRGLFSPVVGRWEEKRPPAEYQGKETSVQPHSRGVGGYPYVRKQWRWPASKRCEGSQRGKIPSQNCKIKTIYIGLRRIPLNCIHHWRLYFCKIWVYPKNNSKKMGLALKNFMKRWFLVRPEEFGTN